MLYFLNDYSEGAHEKVLQHLIDTNMEQLPGYGTDHYCEEAKEKIKKVEQERSNHCYYFTHKHWKDLDNYDFYLKSDFLGIDASINLLSDMIERREIK